MQGRDIIVVGASAGSVPALQRLCSTLPAEFPASIFIVWHMSSLTASSLPRILNRHGSLRAAFAENGEKIQRGRIYIAPPDQHMILNHEAVELNRGPRENRFRPAVDPLFRSAADVFGPRVVGVILSGALDDGAEGLMHIKRMGGAAVVQDPHDAEIPWMPQNAIESVHPDFVIPVTQMPEVLMQLATQPPPPFNPPGEIMDKTSTNEFSESLSPVGITGPPTGLSCPDCNGNLWQTIDDKLVKYTCHVGHTFTESALDVAKSEEVEHALWTALRVLKEYGAVYQAMIDRAIKNGHENFAASFRRKKIRVENQADIIRKALATNSGEAAPSDIGAKKE